MTNDDAGVTAGELVGDLTNERILKLISSFK